MSNKKGAIIIILAIATIALSTPLWADKMTVYYAIDDDEAKVIISAFEKKEKVKIKGMRRSSGQLMKVIEAERKKPVASVVFSGSLPNYIQAKKKGLFAPYKSPVAKNYPEKFKDSQGYWTGIYVGVIGFATNSKSGLTPPRSWADLLKPKYKKKIAISNPASSGTAYTVLATLVQLMGKEKAFNYMKRLHSQVHTYTKSGAYPAKLAGMGVVKIGICFAHDIIRAKEGGLPLKLTFPAEGTGWEIGGVALIKGASHKELAKKFIDFVLSKEAQNLYRKGTLAPRFPTNPQAEPPKGAIPLSSIKVLNFDFEWAGKNQDQLSKEWNKKIYGRHY